MRCFFGAAAAGAAAFFAGDFVAGAFGVADFDGFDFASGVLAADVVFDVFFVVVEAFALFEDVAAFGDALVFAAFVDRVVIVCAS